MRSGRARNGISRRPSNGSSKKNVPKSKKKGKNRWLKSTVAFLCVGTKSATEKNTTAGSNKASAAAHGADRG